MIAIRMGVGGWVQISVGLSNSRIRGKKSHSSSVTKAGRNGQTSFINGTNIKNTKYLIMIFILSVLAI